MNDRPLTIAAFARESGVSRPTIAKWVRTGFLKALQPGGKHSHVYIPRAELVAFLNGTLDTKNRTV